MPEVIRHNSLFLGYLSNGTDCKAGRQPCQDILACARNHDAVCDTIYQASSHTLERAARHVLQRQEREEDRAAWSANRFQRQRDAGKMWHELRLRIEKDHAAPRISQSRVSATSPVQQVSSSSSRASTHSSVSRKARSCSGAHARSRISDWKSGFSANSCDDADF